MDEFDPRITDAKQFLKLANDADTNNRVEALEDLKFVAGDQWPVEIQNNRTLEARPCLTINKIDAYVRQVTNQLLLVQILMQRVIRLLQLVVMI